MAVRFPHVGHSHGHSHSSRRHRAAIQLTLYCDAPRNTRYVSLYCPTPEYTILQHTITVPVYTEYTPDCNCRLSLFSGANCPVHPACLYLDGRSVLTWMYAVCRAPAVWIPPPSRSIFFFYFTYTSFWPNLPCLFRRKSPLPSDLCGGQLSPIARLYVFISKLVVVHVRRCCLCSAALLLTFVGLYTGLRRPLLARL